MLGTKGSGTAKSTKVIKAKETVAGVVQKSKHPPISDMVQNAISVLKEREGSSLYAIKKFISGTYKIEVEKLSIYIKKYLKDAVTNGELVQTKGKGAVGSFKMGKVSNAKHLKKSIDNQTLTETASKQTAIGKSIAANKVDAHKIKVATTTVTRAPKIISTDKKLKTGIKSVNTKKATIKKSGKGNQYVWLQSPPPKFIVLRNQIYETTGSRKNKF